MSKMKLKVWSKKTAASETNEDQLFLRLVYCDDDCSDIVLIVVDIKGNRIDCGNILTIDNDYKCVILNKSISENIPLKTDILGSVLFYTNEDYRDARKRATPQFAGGLLESIAKRIAERSK